MAEILTRDFLVRVPALGFGTAEIRPPLDVTFEVDKSLKHEPNTLNLSLWNIHPDTRLALESLSLKPKAKGLQSGNIRVELEAGYKELGRPLIFRGDVRTARSQRRGNDWVTTIEGEDGGKSILAGRVSRAYPAGTPYLTVVRDCARALGLGEGNVTTAVKTAQVTKSGLCLDGKTADELARVLVGLGLQYTVQNGVLQVQGRGMPLQVQAVLLSEGTGLIGDPERDADGKLYCTALCIPGLFPGGRVLLQSKLEQGLYQIQKIKYTGDLAGKDWYARMELKT